MDQIFAVSLSNLISPPILFFSLGIFLGVSKSDLKFPEGFSKVLSIYLMMAIGFKGGQQIADSSLSLNILYACLLAVGFSFLLPFLGYSFLSFTTKLKTIDRIAVAAHYGSVSVVTFVAALSFLDFRSIPYESYLLLLMVIMEVPAILSALFLKNRLVESTSRKVSLNWKEVFLSGSIVLLLGSLLIGAVSGGEGKQLVQNFFISPFKGVLCLFLLDMGISAGKSLFAFRKAGLRLAVFGIYMPIVSGCLGVLAAHFIGMDLGSKVLFAVLAGSASYIVVPAALKISIPEANSSLYIPLTLGVTFPFNVILGIPLYYFLARLL